MALPAPTLRPPLHIYSEEMDIRRWAQDAERKSREHLRMGGYRVLKMPPLRELPMPWRLRDLEVWGGDWGRGRPPPGVQLEKAGRRIPWMPESELA